VRTIIQKNKRSKWSNLEPGPECWQAKQATRLQEWFWQSPFSSSKENVLFEIC